MRDPDWSSVEPEDIDKDSGFDEQEYYDNITDIGEDNGDKEDDDGDFYPDNEFDFDDEDDE